MDLNLKDRIKIYVNKELYEIGKPKNPSRDQVHVFKELNLILEILFDLLDTQISEPTLKRVKDNFYNNLVKILDFEEQELPGAIENLATNFESFLKLIAFLKYAGTEIWAGDDIYSEGIIKTTFNNLTSGLINNKFSVSSEIPLKEIPEPLVTYKGIQRAILDFIRIELRNAVHNARTYTRLELIHYSNTVISGYLIAVEDNLNSLKRKFLKEYTYLEKIVLESDYKNLDKMYVDLLGQEAIKDIEVYGVEVIDENELLLDVNSFNGFNSKLLLDEDIDYKLVEKRIDNIINIANDTKQFHIVGKPGSGKSTTLLKMEIMMNETTPFRRKLTPLFRGKLTRAFRAN